MQIYLKHQESLIYLKFTVIYLLKNYIKSYYLYDLSLSEIAEENGISRASVLDTLNQANKKLEEYENALHLLVKREKIKEILNSKLKKEEILKELEGIL